MEGNVEGGEGGGRGEGRGEGERGEGKRRIRRRVHKTDQPSSEQISNFPNLPQFSGKYTLYFVLNEVFLIAIKTEKNN